MLPGDFGVKFDEDLPLSLGRLLPAGPQLAARGGTSPRSPSWRRRPSLSLTREGKSIKLALFQKQRRRPRLRYQAGRLANGHGGSAQVTDVMAFSRQGEGCEPAAPAAASGRGLLAPSCSQAAQRIELHFFGTTPMLAIAYMCGTSAVAPPMPMPTPPSSPAPTLT